MNEQLHQIELIKAQAKVELNKLEANSPAKDVAGRAIGKHGLFYITLIVTIGVASSLRWCKKKRLLMARPLCWQQSSTSAQKVSALFNTRATLI